MRATRNRPVYTNEFKTEAVALARRDDRTFRELAEDLGVSVWTLRHWYKMDEMAKRKTKKADAVSRPAVLAPESESLKERAGGSNGSSRQRRGFPQRRKRRSRRSRRIEKS